MLVYRPILNSYSHSPDIPKRRIFFQQKKNAVYKYKLLSRFRWLVEYSLPVLAEHLESPRTAAEQEQRDMVVVVRDHPARMASSSAMLLLVF